MTNEIKIEKCRGCGAEIEWIMTEKGKWMPIDKNPVAVVKDGYVYKAYVSHFAHCPNANEFRKKK